LLTEDCDADGGQSQPCEAILGFGTAGYLDGDEPPMTSMLGTTDIVPLPVRRFTVNQTTASIRRLEVAIARAITAAPLMVVKGTVLKPLFTFLVAIDPTNRFRVLMFTVLVARLLQCMVSSATSVPSIVRRDLPQFRFAWYSNSLA
jgi:hypothetical protein